MTNRLAILERVFHRETRSLGQYLAESWPWTHRADREAEDLVHSILADERRWAQRLVEMINSQGGVSRTANYDEDYTDTNYLALDFMLNRLADHLQHSVAALRSDLAAAYDDAELRTLLEQMIERKGGQVEALRKLAGILAATKVHGY